MDALTPQTPTPQTPAPEAPAPEAPAPEALAPETPVSAEAPGPRWYWRPLTVIATALALGGVAAGLILGGVFSSEPSGMAGVLVKDGYPVTVTVNTDQLDQLGVFPQNTDGQAAKALIVAAAAGVKGSKEEVVFQLTDSGSQLIKLVIATIQSQLPQGEAAHMDGPYLVIDGPYSVLGLPTAT